MRGQFGVFVWCFLLVLSLSNCKKDDTNSGGSPDCGSLPHAYSTDIKPIVLNNCAISGCHVSGGSGPGDFTTYQALANAATNGSLKDRVIIKKDMPPSSSGKTLTQEQRDKILCWINDGAPNN